MIAGFLNHQQYYPLRLATCFLPRLFACPQKEIRKIQSSSQPLIFKNPNLLLVYRESYIWGGTGGRGMVGSKVPLRPLESMDVTVSRFKKKPRWWGLGWYNPRPGPLGFIQGIWLSSNVFQPPNLQQIHVCLVWWKFPLEDSWILGCLYVHFVEKSWNAQFANWDAKKKTPRKPPMRTAKLALPELSPIVFQLHGLIWR